jgi:hypothetical protein
MGAYAQVTAAALVIKRLASTLVGPEAAGLFNHQVHNDRLKA